MLACLISPAYVVLGCYIAATTLQCRQSRFNCANKNGFVQDEILVCQTLLTLNSEFFVQLDFASSMGFVILLPKKKVMCPCSELAIL